MSIYALLQNQGFDPEHCQAMGVAFEEILQELELKDRSNPLCTLVAQTLIELGQHGIRDPERLQDLALAAIRF
jgi:hypothetical protein